jgi:hypothetical protein
MHSISHICIEQKASSSNYVTHLCGTSVIEHVIVFNSSFHHSVIFNPLSVNNYETLHCSSGLVNFEFLFVLDLASLETFDVLVKLGFVLVSTFCATRATSNFKYRYWEEARQAKRGEAEQNCRSAHRLKNWTHTVPSPILYTTSFHTLYNCVWTGDARVSSGSTCEHPPPPEIKLWESVRVLTQ